MRVCVVGAGVVGLTTAWQVIEQIKGASVTVVAEKFTSETTSHGAAGIFSPCLAQTTAHDFERICADSWEFFNGIVKSSEARNAGISVIDGYQLYSKIVPIEGETYRKFVYHFESVDVGGLTFLPDIKDICQAFHFTTLMVECRRFLPWITEKLKQKGVTFQRRFVSKLNEIVADDFDLIFNCAGLGNQQLLGDTKLMPYRGQVVRVQAPWIKQFILLDDFTYIIPGQDSVVLGGCYQGGNYDLSVNEADTLSIWNRCKKLVPTLAQAVVDNIWVGLRPVREELHIEDGGLLHNPVTGRNCRIVHNYGHGSNGVGLSMGSACLAVTLAKRSLNI